MIFNYSIKMTEFYLLIINNTEKELEQRLKSKKWPINEKTTFRGNMVQNDKIVIYQAGPNFHRFVATGIVKSFEHDTDHKYINLDKIKIFSPVDIKSIYHEMNLIRNPKYYGAYLAGGVKNITEHDFNLIVKN
jgi:predicted RNA-binding protein